jgi:hypothetical protein
VPTSAALVGTDHWIHDDLDRQVFPERCRIETPA